jgi:hypothetical protein
LAPLIVSLTAAIGQQAEPTKETPARPEDAKRAALLHEVYLREATEYEFGLDTEKHEKLELKREPVMRWTSEGDYNGEVYVWTQQGMASIVGCIFSGPGNAGQRQIMHEFHSLTAESVTVAGAAGSRWHAREPGIALQPIPGAPEPARTKVLRLTQMRDLARQFTAQVDRQGGMSEMRLLPQPIYRYEVNEAGPVVDGAVFAYVWTAGTDPEALLVIEARRNEGAAHWQYAPARFTNREARLRHKGREVWKAEQSTTGIFDGVTSKPYGAFSVKTIAEPSEK